MKVAHKGGHHANVVCWPKIDIATFMLEGGRDVTRESIHGYALSKWKWTHCAIQIELLVWIGTKFEPMALKVNPMILHMVWTK